ncbi:hypothetical protein AgCh_039117 [Apium graveolens]
MEIKFLELKKGDMSVADYEAKFTELSRYDLYHVQDEKRKARRCQLTGPSKNRPGTLGPFVWPALVVVQKALIVEGSFKHYRTYQDGRKREIDDEDNKHKGNKFRKVNQFKKMKEGSKIKRNGDEKEPVSIRCKYCGNKHKGVCTKRNNTCFNCGMVGHLATACKKPQTGHCFKYGEKRHFARECPQNEDKSHEEKELKGSAGAQPKKRPNARTFNMSVRDALEADDVITCATPIPKTPYRIAPREMKELMVQLKDMLEKKFIRPSVSPWGASVLFIKRKMDQCDFV